MAQTHWKKLANPNYLGAYSIEDGKDLVLTVRKVVQETVIGADGKKEDCIVCYWQENQKPMILNSTNCKMIQKLLDTPYIEQWAGHRLQIGTEKVRAFGDVVDALRVRKKLPAAAEPPIPCADCGQVIAPAYNMTASQLAAYTEKQYGRKLCAECAKKAKEAGKESADAESHA